MPYIKKTEDLLEVIENLPLSYGMTSNYHLLDRKTHIKDGFFELDISEPEIAEDEELAVTDPVEYEFVDSTQTYKRKFIIRKKNHHADELNSDQVLEQERIQLLRERHQRLSICDWVELPSVKADMDPAIHNKWMEYRKQLRTCVKVPDPKDVVWPTAPYSPVLGSKYSHRFIS